MLSVIDGISRKIENNFLHDAFFRLFPQHVGYNVLVKFIDK